MTAAPAPAPRALDLTRLDGGTRAAVSCAVQDLDGLGRFVAAARAMLADWYASPDPADLFTLAGLIDAAERKVGTLRGRLSDLVAAEDLDRLDEVPAAGPAAEGVAP